MTNQIQFTSGAQAANLGLLPACREGEVWSEQLQQCVPKPSTTVVPQAAADPAFYVNYAKIPAPMMPEPDFTAGAQAAPAASVPSMAVP